MKNIANKVVVLSLNGNWMPICMRNVQDAIVSMISGTAECPPALGLDIEYEIDPNDPTRPLTDKVLYINPVKWDKWIELPIRPWDLTISTVNRVIRVPTVIVNSHFNKMPTRKAKPTKYAIAERDGWKCQYSNEPLTRATANIDHVVPKSKGGRSNWTNLVLCHKDLNSKKGNKSNDEIGYKLIRTPKEPMPMPISSIIKDIRHVDWAQFIIAKK